MIEGITGNIMFEEKDYQKLKADYEALQEENKRLKEVEEIFRTSLSLTDHAVTYVDIPSRTLHRLYKKNSFSRLEDVVENVPESILESDFVVKEDAEIYRKIFQDIYDGEPYGESEIFRTQEDGRVDYVKMHYKTLFDSDNAPSKAVVFIDDVTSKVNAEKRYLEYRKAVVADTDFLWEVNLSKDLLLFEDMKGETLWEKDHFKSYTDILSSFLESVVSEYHELVEKTFNLDTLLNAFAKGQRDFIIEFPTRSTDGKIVWLQTKIYLLINADTDLCALLCSNNITKWKLEQERLLKQAQSDELTGLLNRRTFQEHTENFLRQRTPGNSVLMIIDIDDFKQMNDRWGHVFGDSVLALISEKMRKSFRKSDLISRIGGDEFMILAKGIKGSIKDGFLKKRLSDLQEELKNIKTPDGNHINVTLSIGGAQIQDGDTFHDIYKRADSVLYEVKKCGKNGFKVI